MVCIGPIHRSVVVNSEQSAVNRLCQRLLCEVEDSGFSQDELFGIHLALEEAFINAIKHGNSQNPRKQVTIEYTIMPEKFEISITDEGNGFNPGSVPDPRCDGNLYKNSGRGLLLMRSYMNVVQYNQAGNCVHMIKYKGNCQAD